MPNEWVIKFQGPIKDWVDFPLTVVCTDVEVDYAAGASYALMEDGSPQAIDLTVSFKETTQLSRQKYVEHVSAAMGSKRIFAKGSKLIPDQPTAPTTEEKSGSIDPTGTVDPNEALESGGAGSPTTRGNLNARLLAQETAAHGDPDPKLSVEEQRARDYVQSLGVVTGRAYPFRVVEGKPQSGWMRFFDGNAGYKDRPRIRKFLRRGLLNPLAKTDDPGG
jgi:hypothetical protein